MRKRPLAVAFAVSLITSASLVFLACSQGTTGESHSPNSTEPTTRPSEAAATPSLTPGQIVATGSAQAPALAACKDVPLALAEDLPDGGMTMTNAAPAPSSSAAVKKSDREAPVYALMKRAQDRFRCCFDAGGHHKRGTETNITLVIDLKPKGALRDATIDPKTTDPVEPAVTECIVDVAKNLTYPESGIGDDTTVRYRMPFRGRE